MKILGHSIERPSYVPMTAWLRHGPFAMWLVKASRPKRIVELGSHYGFSYFSFCQAVKEADLETHCFAIDTWQGDEHSGFYGNEVFEAVNRENKKYTHFSKLLRKTFNEALDDIEDGSVDLLHIDGRHFYQDVKEDFESWIPKLADRAIILFHDTEVRERDFGVWEYWNEITKEHVGFNFPFQHGLGVLFWGDDLTSEMAEFRNLIGTDSGRDAIIALFYALGQEISEDHTRHVFARISEQDPEALPEQLGVFDNSEINPENQISRLTPGSLAIAKRLSEEVSLGIQRSADLGKLETTIDAVSKERDHLAAKLAQIQAEFTEAQTQNKSLRKELALTRSRAALALKDNLYFKILNGLLVSRLPISEKARARFARSARKRDPLRSLAGEALSASEQVLQTIDAPMPTTTNSAILAKGKIRPDSSRRNVLIVAHEASYTGAPILAHNIMRVLSERYNVYGVTLRGGDLMDAFLDVSVEVLIAGRHPEVGNSIWRYLKKFLDSKGFDFAVVNSIEARRLLPILNDIDVPSIALVHEFASYTRPRTAFREVLKYADEIVFSSPLTLDNASEVTGLDAAPNIHVLPQGKCIVPNTTSEQSTISNERLRLLAHLRPSGHENDFLVIGAGHVQIRKGVDLFLEVARQVMTEAKGRSVRFVWIGSGYDPEEDMSYCVYLQDQLKRSKIFDKVRIIAQTTEIEYAYELADALLLTSRLDPLPNVAIDAMLAGTPVLCFDSASGMSEVLREGRLHDECVAEYLNTFDMAHKLQVLASSPALYSDVVNRTKSHAAKIFDLNNYVSRIESLALSARTRKKQRAEDANVIAAEPLFRSDYVLSPGEASRSVRELAELYLQKKSSGLYPRHPEPGFNPQIYASHLQSKGTGVIERDPYAHFLLEGRPSGPWSLQVIRETDDAMLTAGAKKLRTALHIHAYYTDALPDLLAHLRMNQSRPTLYVTVSNEASQAEAMLTLADYDGEATCKILPNSGRDIGPFLSGVAHDLVASYDIVGHIHTKKSISLSDDAAVAHWTRFMHENILGGDAGGAMLDRILNAFAADPQLGVVFPADPNVMNWTRNRGYANKLAERMELGPLPDAIDFPIGTMFWMRSPALQPFVDLRLGWDDYPPEPVEYDGTILHALERLFGVAPILKGYHAAVTAVSGVTR